ncbi:MAG TPA: sigma-70 family RNA polymerase sigma factor [Thermoleophilaceae bacterium]|nr:sigma-70 family RNA polymerase sigma factor [Thermoleophilaceae bacterium]
MRPIPSRDPLAHPEPLIRRVYAYVAYRVGDGPAAEDITGETFVRAVRYRDSYDPAKGKPADWLLGIASRCISDARTERETQPPPEEISAAGDVAAEAADRLALRAGVGELSERDRELIALRYGADLSAPQIARHLGRRTNSVEVALHRALGRLREALGEHEAPEPRVFEPPASASRSHGGM